MDKDVVIQVNSLSKKYKIFSEYQATTLQEKLGELIKNPLRIFQKQKTKNYWALKDINFEVKRGEVLGIIGKNGAGKSTLLKILSRITEPTTGSIHMRGRVSSLLEVGTGFNPELTGRENIYLNGAIIGMSKNEINSKFNDIIGFAGIGEFLDTPVKRYSSGMYVRLAFAVAAHLDTDILIVDEVLAVGDADFQKKSFNRIMEMVKDGRTVLLVSHNMSAISKFCTKVLLLDKGKTEVLSNDVNGVVSNYFASTNLNSIARKWKRSQREEKNSYFNPESMYVISNNKSTNNVSRFTEAYLIIKGYLIKPTRLLTIGYAIYAEDENCLFWSYPTDTDQNILNKERKGMITLKTKIPTSLLNNGKYYIRLIGGIHNKKWLFNPMYHTPTISLYVQGIISNSRLWDQQRPTIISPIIKWEVNYE